MHKKSPASLQKIINIGHYGFLSMSRVYFQKYRRAPGTCVYKSFSVCFANLEKKKNLTLNLLEYIISSSLAYAKLGFELKGFFSVYGDVSTDVEITELMLDTGKSSKSAKTEGPIAVVRLFPTPQSVFS